jgi:hypothetical protein
VSGDDDCDWRISEMKLISYTPNECVEGTFDYCDKLVAYVRLDIHKQKQEEALLAFLTTIFTVCMLAAGQIMF